MTKDEELGLVERAFDAVLKGIQLDSETLYSLTDIESAEGVKALCDKAAELTGRLSRDFDSCSIVNARSGHCSEDCKWCAQSGRFHTGCNTYDIVDREEALEQARHNKAGGVKRFSLVARDRKSTRLNSSHWS